MKKRTTWILAGIVAALGIFIFAWERHQVTSGETSEREGRLLPTFVRDRVTRLEITRGGKKIVLERPTPEEPGLMVDWRLKQPVAGAADDDAVDSVVGALEWLDARRTVGTVSDADRQRFGLDRPRVRLTYTLSGGTTGSLVVGGPAEGEGVYVQAGDDVVHVVGQDLFEALDHDANHYRDKSIAEVRASKVKTIVLGGAAGERRLERRDGVWHLAGANGGRANTAQVEEMLRALEGLDATRFVADVPSGGTADARFGLSPGRATARIESDGSPTVTLRVGAPCEGHTDDEVFVMREGSGVVACTAKSLLDTLGRTADSLRDRRLLSATADTAAWIEVRAGDSRVKVTKTDDAWALEHPRRAPADEDAVEGFLRELRGFEALGTEASGPAMPADARTVTVHLAANRDETFRCIAAGTDAPATAPTGADAGTEAPAPESRPTAICQRGNETARLRMDASVLDLMAPLALRFQARRIVRDGSGDGRRLVIEGEGGRQQVENRDGTWHLTSPIEAEADAMSVRSLVQRVATLTVVRFVADRRAPEHGLDSPRYTLSARFEGTARPDEEVRASDDDEHGDPDDDAPDEEADAGPRPRERSYVLRIGAATEGGAFAELEGFPGVFVVSQGLLDELRRPLVERSFLQVDRADVRSIVLVRGADRLELVREGDTWRGAGRTFPAERMDPLLDRLTSLRASSTTRFGAPGADEGLASPRAIVTVRRDGDGGANEVTFRIGAAFGPEGSREAYARRDGLEATFVLSD
ncbi:MAG: DUF4340 domain-containing protein, partial [Deltaproteobacteria bacterium]|nr:DUF4340 domain-containing protein [Deltaproteobacteria bacterium]